MSYTTTDIPDLTGKTAVVTGANSGLGLESAKALAGAGAHVVMAARNQEKAQAASRRDQGRLPGCIPRDRRTRPCFAGIDQGCGRVHRRTPPHRRHPHQQRRLMAMPERRTEDGFEMQLRVNHFGHWTFTAGLLPSLLAADSARVVTVTSTAHHSAARSIPTTSTWTATTRPGVPTAGPSSPTITSPSGSSRSSSPGAWRHRASWRIRACPTPTSRSTPQPRAGRVGSARSGSGWPPAPA